MSAPGGIDHGGAAEAGVQNALATLKGLLTVDETLEAWAIQHRLYALTHRRLLLAATSGRFITLTRHLFGGYDSADIRWQDLRERVSARGSSPPTSRSWRKPARISVSLPRSTGCGPSPGCARTRRSRSIGSGQQHDQVWREKRRVRELEELRAKSGGVQFGGATFGAGSMGTAGLDGSGGYGAASTPGVATRRPGDARRVRGGAQNTPGTRNARREAHQRR